MAGKARTASITVDKQIVQPGDTINIQVMVTTKEWIPVFYEEYLYFEDQVLHKWDGTLYVTNPTDTLTYTYTIPHNITPKTYTITARERSEGLFEGKSVQITVVAPPPPGQGTLSITTVPSGASVTVDNQRTGMVTPCVVYLSPGIHILRLTKSGYKPYYVQASIAPGMTTYVAANLTPVEKVDYSKYFLIAGAGGILYYLISKREKIAPYARAAYERGRPIAEAAYARVRRP